LQRTNANKRKKKKGKVQEKITGGKKRGRTERRVGMFLQVPIRGRTKQKKGA